MLDALFDEVEQAADAYARQRGKLREVVLHALKAEHGVGNRGTEYALRFHYSWATPRDRALLVEGLWTALKNVDRISSGRPEAVLARRALITPPVLEERLNKIFTRDEVPLRFQQGKWVAVEAAAASSAKPAPSQKPQPNVTDSLEILLRALYQWERARDEAGQRGHFNSKSVADELGWRPTTLNRAVDVLEKRGWVEVDRSSGSAPFTTHGFSLSEEGFMGCEREGLDRPADRTEASAPAADVIASSGKSLTEFVPSELRERFEAVHHLGWGSYASVYEVVDRDTLQRFALKVTANSPEARDRAHRELDAGRTLSHQNILEVLEHDPAGKWFLLPLADGTLGQMLAWGRAGTGSAFEVAHAVLSALLHAHDADFIHRDLHPDNVLRQDGQWKVADWGLTLARKHDRMTRTKSAGGTVIWTAPEQLKSLKDADERSDLFSLGRLVEWLASGVLPDPAKPGDLGTHPLAEFVGCVTRLNRDERPRSSREALGLLPALTVTNAAATSHARTES